jgi:glycosyltransferase involved in cell wall biosynthesis
MKILLFNWRDPTHPWAGGAEVFLYELARRWLDQGHQVSWYCSRHPTQAPSHNLNGIEIHRQGGFYGVFARAPLHFLTKGLGRFDVIVDSANGIPFFTPLYTRTPKIVLVHHVHSEVFFRELPLPLAHLANALERFVMPLVYRRTPFVTVSNSTRQALAVLGIPADQVRLVHNGVDLEAYQPGPKSQDPTMLFLGRLRHYKSVDVAIRALPLLLESVPDLHFNIAGSGPAETALRRLAQQLGLENRVHFHGYVTDEVKKRLLKAAHIVVNPSFTEGWGLTVLEANACGTPVVGADVPGLRDSIHHGKTGLLVPYGDPKALAEAVGHLLADGELRQRMTHQALDWVKHFNWKNSADRFLELIIQVVNEGKL